MTVASVGVSRAPQRNRPLRCTGWVLGTAVSLLLTSACAGAGDDGSPPDPTGTGESATSAAADGSTTPEESAGAAAPPEEPVDVAAALSRFQPPEPSSGLPAADPAHCPGADPEPLLTVFPEAAAFQAASMIPEPPDAREGEVIVQCRMSYEVLLLEDECTLMEVRDIAFDETVEGTQDTVDGALATTSRMTYFTGRAQRPGITLDYTLSAGCDETVDLSDLEDEFRSIWIQHRDRFVKTPPYQRP